MATLPAGLIWLASYPKSGNTWMRILFANLLSDTNQPCNINNLAEEEFLMGRWRFCDELLVEAETLYPDELADLRAIQGAFVARNLAAPFLCKTHEKYSRKITGVPLSRGIYIVRDPRDVVISLSYHLRVSIDDAIVQMLDPDCQSGGPTQLRHPMGDWASHVTGWTLQTDIPLEVVRYEDLRRDTRTELARIIGSLGGTASSEEIERAIAFSSLRELQRQEATYGFRESRAHQDRFFRAGRIEEWRQVLNIDQIAAIETAFAPVMKQWGYATRHNA